MTDLKTDITMLIKKRMGRGNPIYCRNRGRAISEVAGLLRASKADTYTVMSAMFDSGELVLQHGELHLVDPSEVSLLLRRKVNGMLAVQGHTRDRRRWAIV